MQYPNHLILDVSSTPNFFYFKKWDNIFLTKLKKDYSMLISLNYIKTLQQLTVFFPKNNFLKTFLQKTFIFSSKTFELFDVNFLRKDKLYTKLKYSRCPQYDIVSGGWAALFAGLLGFLISEKFGIELVDSGDFYTAFMYGVFFCFSLRPLLRIIDKNSTWKTCFLLKNLMKFLLNMLQLFLKYLKNVRFFKTQ